MDTPECVVCSDPAVVACENCDRAYYCSRRCLEANQPSHAGLCGLTEGEKIDLLRDAHKDVTDGQLASAARTMAAKLRNIEDTSRRTMCVTLAIAAMPPGKQKQYSALLQEGLK